MTFPAHHLTGAKRLSKPITRLALAKLNNKHNNYKAQTEQEAQLMLTTGSTRLAVSRGQQTWYHSTCYI